MSKRKYHEFSKIFAMGLIDNDLTQKELCQIMGLDKVVLSNYYTGKTLPSVTRVYELSKTLKLNPEIILEAIAKDKGVC